jgi:hypothetical protein
MSPFELNLKMEKMFVRADKAAAAASGGAESELIKAYRYALNDIRKRMLTLFDDTKSSKNMMKRLEKISRQVDTEIARLNKKAGSFLTESILRSYNASLATTGEAITRTINTGIDLIKINTDSIAYEVSDKMWLDLLKKHNGKLLSESKMIFETALRQNARQDVVAGLVQGVPYSTVAKKITARFNVAATRAKTIATTEMHKAHNAGRMAGIKQAEKSAARVGIKTQRVWRHNPTKTDYRPEHVAADGQVAVNGRFFVGGEYLEAPGIGGSAENVINCHCSAIFKVVGL